jgi:hypothetical protein
LTHGATGTPEYRIWKSIKDRCRNPKNPAWKNYGGRGITVCPEWAASFEAFLAHVGVRPNPVMTLDRIDNERGYEPGNVRWATRAVQRSNCRRVVLLTIRGETKPRADWARLAGIPPITVKHRMNRGWDAERAVFTPMRQAPSR